MNSLSMTENAAKRISELMASEHNDISMLRVLVSSGGCSGFSYSFELESKINNKTTRNTKKKTKDKVRKNNREDKFISLGL